MGMGLLLRYGGDDLTDWGIIKSCKIELRQMGDYPKPLTENRKCGPYKAPLGATAGLLKTELKQMNGHE